jgi:hypothetical protein
MERMTKFRGFCHSEDKWVYGYLVAEEEGWDVIKSMDDGLMYSVAPASVGAYIGYKDRKQRNIYEKDILSMKLSVNYKSVYAIVLWHGTGWGVKWDKETAAVRKEQDIVDLPLNLRQLSGNPWSVVANTYENPDFLVAIEVMVRLGGQRDITDRIIAQAYAADTYHAGI